MSELAALPQKGAVTVAKRGAASGGSPHLGEAVLRSSLENFAASTEPDSSEEALVMKKLAERRLSNQVTLWRDLGALPRPTPWRDISDDLRACYLQLALHRAKQWVRLYQIPGLSGSKILPYPTTYTWDLNLSNEVQASALASSEGPADFISRRLRKAMAREHIPFWFALEFDAGGRLHLHGSLACSTFALNTAKEILYRTAGPVGAHKPYALKVQALPSERDGLFKARYSTKQLQATRNRIGWSAVATTHQLIREARKLHGWHRGSFCGQGTAPEVTTHD